MSGNSITEFSVLGSLPYLMKLNISQNAIKDLKPLYNEENFKCLKYLCAHSNKITEL